MKAAELKNVSFKYRNQKKSIFEDFSIGFDIGKITFLLGENGSGKSTLLGLLSGALSVNTGKVLFQESEIKNAKKRSAIIGYVPQGTNLDGEMSVSDCIDFIGSCYDISQKEIQERKTKLVSAFGIDGFLHQRIRFLSGGQKQRVSILLGLLHEPDIVLLDEPFVGLDFYSVSSILSELIHLNKTVICVTHDIDIAESHAHSVMLLKEGKLLVKGTPNDIIKENSYYLIEVDFKSSLPKIKPEASEIKYTSIHNRMIISYPNSENYHSVVDAFLKENREQIGKISTSVNTLKASMVGLQHLSSTVLEPQKEKGKGQGRGDGSGGGKGKNRS